MYDEFINKGWPSSEIHIFVKPSRMSETDRELCDSLEKIGNISLKKMSQIAIRNISWFETNF